MAEWLTRERCIVSHPGSIPGRASVQPTLDRAFRKSTRPLLVRLGLMLVTTAPRVHSLSGNGDRRRVIDTFSAAQIGFDQTSRHLLLSIYCRLCGAPGLAVAGPAWRTRWCGNEQTAPSHAIVRTPGGARGSFFATLLARKRRGVLRPSWVPTPTSTRLKPLGHPSVVTERSAGETARGKDQLRPVGRAGYAVARRESAGTRRPLD